VAGSGLKVKKSLWKGSARGLEGFLFDLPVPTRPEKGVQKTELPHPLAEISAVYIRTAERSLPNKRVLYF
jgi:hypothetical protein